MLMGARVEIDTAGVPCWPTVQSHREDWHCGNYVSAAYLLRMLPATTADIRAMSDSYQPGIAFIDQSIASTAGQAFPMLRLCASP